MASRFSKHYTPEALLNISAFFKAWSNYFAFEETKGLLLVASKDQKSTYVYNNLNKKMIRLVLGEVFKTSFLDYYVMNTDWKSLDYDYLLVEGLIDSCNNNHFYPLQEYVESLIVP